MNTFSLNPLLNPLITIAAIAGAAYLLVSQKMIFIPIALALLFAFFILPAAQKLEARGVPRIAANMIMIILGLAFVIGVGLLLSVAISGFINDIPGHLPQIQTNIATLQEFIARTLRIPAETQNLWISENVSLIELATRNFGTVASTATKIATTLSLTVIYTFFLLYYRDKIMRFFQKLLGRKDELAIVGTLRKIVAVVPRYLSGVVWVMVILAVVNSLGFWAIGVPNPIFFGIFAAVLNVIPYIGPIIGFAIVVLFCLAVAGPGIAIGAVVMFIIVQFLENNILTPNISGGSINVNPLAAIVGIIVGGAMWGVVGMVIALPFMGMLKVICDANPAWEAWGYLLGDTGTEEHAITWASFKGWFRKGKKQK